MVEKGSLKKKKWSGGVIRKTHIMRTFGNSVREPTEKKWGDEQKKTA